MFELFVVYTAEKEGNREAFVRDVKAAGYDEIIRGEDGCISYDYYAAMEDPNKLLLIERWESEEKQQIHVKQPHMTELRAIKDRYIVDTKLCTFRCDK